jgi:hypothetical protein
MSAGKLNYVDPDGSNLVPLDVVVLGRSTMLELNNGMVVRRWRFLPNKKIKGAVLARPHR